MTRFSIAPLLYASCLNRKMHCFNATGPFFHVFSIDFSRFTIYYFFLFNLLYNIVTMCSR